jgi:hypothetical protein
MIPVKPAPEPKTFQRSVREPGLRFLAKHPQPSDREWRKHAYWQLALGDMRRLYHCICAYSAHYIAPDTGVSSVDHFISKSNSPRDAYEWSNYRLAASRLNARKARRRVLDPFTILPGTFAIHFPSLQVVPGPLCDLNESLRTLVLQSCAILGLNDEATCITNRQQYVGHYCSGNFTFQLLRRHAPFLAFEIERAGLGDLERIRSMMSWPFELDDL